MSDAKNQTVLGPDCRISGELALDNNAVVMGGYDGTLRVTGTLELAESAEVKGTIIAGSVRILGRVEADIVAENIVEVLPGAVVRGQIFTRQISIVEGASVQADLCVGPDAVSDQESADEDAAPAPARGQAPAAHDGDDEDESSVSTVSGAVETVLNRRRAATMTSTRQPARNGSR